MVPFKRFARELLIPSHPKFARELFITPCYPSGLLGDCEGERREKP
jgi:hypothetical protein